MSKKKDYYFDLTPRWILYSSLPEQLNKKYGELAWSIFHCLIQLDCRYNPDYPDTFDQSFEDIAALTGTTRQTIWKYIKLFERDDLLRVKRGRSKREKSTFKITNPIKTPKHHKEIHALHGGLFNRKGRQPLLRYAQPVKDVNELEKPNQLKTDNQPVKDTNKHVKDVNIPNIKEKKRKKRKPSANVFLLLLKQKKEYVCLPKNKYISVA